MILDTTFLIDLERELLKKIPGKAMKFLTDHPEAVMRISVVTLGELAEGYADDKGKDLQEMTAPYDIVEIGKETALAYGRLSRAQRAAGSRMGDNDLWIAAAAIQRGETLVTRNGGHFDKIPNLSITTY